MPAVETVPRGWAGPLAWHTLAITLLANLGKMFPLLCYRSEAEWRERLALCVACGRAARWVRACSWSRRLRHRRSMVAVATFSLALNLVLTGVFIVIVKALLRAPGAHKIA